MKSILVIGGGSIGRRHVCNLSALGERDIVVVEPNALRAQELVRELGVTTAPSLEEAWSRQTFQVTFVCSPSIYHLDQARISAEQGSDLFIEKPLAHTLEGVQKLLALTEKNNLITMVGSNWKFYPLFQKMKELIDQGAIGRVLSARCQCGQYLPDWHPWEDYRQGYSARRKLGGGILLDSHEFDYLTWFLGDVKKLACFAGRISNLEIDVEDTAEIVLQFTSGAIGEIHLDYTQRFAQRSFEFFGESGTLSWTLEQKKVLLRRVGYDPVETILPPEYDLNMMYREEAKHFLHSVETRQETLMPIGRGAEVIRLICSAKESAQTERVTKLS